MKTKQTLMGFQQTKTSKHRTPKNEVSRDRLGVRRVKRGPASFRDGLVPASSGLKRRTVYKLSIPPTNSTFMQSDEMYARWIELLNKSIRVMGNLIAAREWLDAPKYGLEDKTPIELAQSKEGFKEVCQLLNRIEHGIFS